jgi:hypothetical protein
MRGETTGLWVIIAYYNLTPCDVYGLFDSKDEAWNYAHTKQEKMGCYTYDVRPVLNAFYEEKQHD